jgi:hypothetical protein
MRKGLIIGLVTFFTFPLFTLRPAWGQDSSSSPAEVGTTGFQVSALPEVPAATPPRLSIANDIPRIKPPPKMHAGKDINLRSFDIDTLGKFDDAVKFDKSEATPEEKAAKWHELGSEVKALEAIALKRAAEWEQYSPQSALNEMLKFDRSVTTPEAKATKWRELSGKYPQFVNLARRRSEDWSRYSAELTAQKTAQVKRDELRDKDWATLGKLLSFSVVSDMDKRRFALAFVQAYGRDAWHNPYGSGLTPYLPRENIKFPFNIKVGMTGQDVVELLREGPVKGSIRWPMSGQVAFKNFRPSFLVVHTDFINPGWAGAKGDARRTAPTGGEAEFKAMMDAWEKEDNEQYGLATFGKVFSVGLYQDIPDCDGLRSALSDAVKFIETNYFVTKKHLRPHEEGGMTGYIDQAKDCLGGEYKFSWVGSNGYGIDLAAGNDQSGSAHLEGMQGMFSLMLDYTKVVESTPKIRQPSKPTH